MAKATKAKKAAAPKSCCTQDNETSQGTFTEGSPDGEVHH